jgi:hypothetical protein
LARAGKASVVAGIAELGLVEGEAVPEEMKPATRFTAEVNRAAVARYAMDDRADFGDVERRA